MSTTVGPNRHVISTTRGADEVIDVDAFVERPAQRRRVERSTNNNIRGEPIIISDDDDEVVIVSERPRRRLSGGRLASLPPPQQNNAIPPVPPLPRNLYMGHIQPNAEPFAFEEEFAVRRSPTRQQSPLVPPPPRAAPRSHHQPAMGFGGALIAANRRNQSQQPEEGTLARLLDLPRRIIFRMPFFGQALDEQEEEDLFLNFAAGFPHQDNIFHVRHPQPAAPDYKPEYTHLKSPPPGFTHDFEPPTEAASATMDDPIVVDDDSDPGAPPSVTLVCARCFDPLVLTAEMTDSDEIKLRKLWGLRCGHVLDSKCVSELMCPTPAKEVDTSQLPVRPDVKGKGKAVDPPDELNIRSRLRSRTSAHAPSETTTVPPRTKRTRSRKAKTVVQEVHEWTCPVKNCEHVHASLKVNGIWVPDQERGPLGLFV